jgi:hypothetical protein
MPLILKDLKNKFFPSGKLSLDGYWGDWVLNMAPKRYPKPVYELVVDETYKYHVSFSEMTISRDEAVFNGLSQRFTGTPEYIMRMLKPREYKDLGLIGLKAAVDEFAGETAESLDFDGAIKDHMRLMRLKEDYGREEI